MQERINQFALDASRIASELDKLTRRDPPELRAAAVQTGRQAYQELLERQYSLALSPADTSYIQMILDGIKARLRFLS
ncbi:MAG TPA: hypothetical protein VJV22_13310 [Acidobacteriaceae bacterium]|nr:hypothetical protein [Acidobacteriaceae bacterium]